MSISRLKIVGVYLVIFILFVSAIGLGYLIFRQMSGGNNKTSQEKEASNNRSFVPVAQMSDLSPQEKALLYPLPDNATDAQKTEYKKLVESLAKDTKVINLNNCNKPDPYVAKVRISEGMDFKNDSSAAINIRLSSGAGYTIPEKSTKHVKLAFKKGEGLYTYRCDGVDGVAGFFNVIR